MLSQRPWRCSRPGAVAGRDLPDGSCKELEAIGAKQKSKGAGNVAILGFSNTNALIMLVTYGLCFGVELCMNAKLTPYFTRYYAFPTSVASPLGACFSLMNLFARSWGGLLSDFMNKKACHRAPPRAARHTQPTARRTPPPAHTTRDACCGPHRR